MRTRRILAGQLAFAILSSGAAAKDGDEKLQEERFKVFSRDGESELGTYQISAVAKGEDKKEIEISDTVVLEMRERKMSIVSKVTYVAGKPLSPTKASVVTKIDGELCMKGSVTLTRRTFDHECTGFLDRRSGEKIDPPKKYGKKGAELPEGIVVFQSALIALGPKLMPEAGELDKFAWVEFPDDIGAPELINVKGSYRLVRERADAKGEFAIKLYGRGDDDPTASIRYSKDGKIVAIDALGGLRLVVDKAKR